jgi:PleD family two-component response regulator
LGSEEPAWGEVMTGCYGVRVSRRLRRSTWRDWHRLRDPGQPDRRVGEEDRRTEEERNAEGARPPATILVVDDDPSVQWMLVRMLQAENYNVVEAADGLDALDQCARHPVAALVTDVRMPRMGVMTIPVRSVVRISELTEPSD